VRWLPLPALLLLAGPVRAEEDDPPFRLSLPTAEDREVWQEPGFRLQIGYGYGGLAGVGGAPDASTHAALVRLGARLEGPWSLYGTLRYALATGDISGAHFTGTIEPTWHVSRGWRLALGVGVAGIVESEAVRPEPDAAQRGSLVAPYTYPEATPNLPVCSGLGTVALARVGYWWVLGPLSSLGLSLQTDAQWTGCEEDLQRVEPDTATPIVRRQWWQHQAWSLAGLVAWR